MHLILQLKEVVIIVKDWVGNKHSTFVTLGASNHTDQERAEHDSYATSPKAIDMLAEAGKLPKNKDVWECVDADTEFFNGEQWIKISEYNEDENVLVYCSDGSAKLESPIKYIVLDNCKAMYHFSNKHLDFCCTENHRIPYLHRRKDELCVDYFQNIINSYETDSNGFRGRLLCSFNYSGNIELNEWYLRLAVACQADGRQIIIYKTGLPTKINSYELRVKKQRKVERLKWILNNANIEYKHSISGDGLHRFYFQSPLGCKTFPNEWHQLNNRLKKIILEEVVHWDGNISLEGICRYTSTNKHNIDFIQMIAHSCGKVATISKDKRMKLKHQQCYTITFSHVAYSAMNKQNCKSKNNKSILEKINNIIKVYCFTVSTGMFVIRRNDKISITGNCAAGQGHLSKALEKYDYNVISTDLIDRGYGTRGVDFFEQTELLAPCILTNPPFRRGIEFLEHAIHDLQCEEYYGFYKLTFLESIKRCAFFDKYPPAEVLVFTKRIQVAINGAPEMFAKSSAACYAWFIWRKGVCEAPKIGWL
jgi:hypothetical protein